jgi:hypothetical protein
MGDVHNRAAASLDHLRNQEAIEADRGQKVQVQFAEPVIVRQGGKAASRRRRAADNIRKDVDAAHAFENRLCQLFSAICCRQVRLDEFHAVDRLWAFASGGDHTGAAGQKAIDGSPAQALSASADEHALSHELGWISVDVHTVISKDVIASSSSVKR